MSEPTPRTLPYGITSFTFKVLRARMDGTNDFVCLVIDRLDGRDVLHMPAEAANQMGQALVDQALLISPSLKVVENNRILNHIPTHKKVR